MDLVILTDEKGKFLDDPAYFSRFGEISRQSVEHYGRCTSLRVFYEDGREVEFGLVDGAWADVPLDAGTRQVLSDGFRVLVDKAGILRIFSCKMAKTPEFARCFWNLRKFSCFFPANMLSYTRYCSALRFLPQVGINVQLH